MIQSDFRHIAFDDSYLLGWEKRGDTLEFIVELLLTDKHPLFEPYDEKTEHGCYRRARLLVENIIAIKGLPHDLQRLQWNEEMDEYDDVAEIDSLILDDANTLKIEADEFNFSVKGGGIKIIFD